MPEMPKRFVSRGLVVERQEISAVERLYVVRCPFCLDEISRHTITLDMITAEEREAGVLSKESRATVVEQARNAAMEDDAAMRVHMASKHHVGAGGIATA